ncbi:DNA alkylation repair protein [Paenibacillus methanolicus]|nr:DNA alkylation repair protein [Paenibacillus methanolicus]
MTYEEVMAQLEAMGTEQTKRTFLRHGAKEPFFGVRIGDMKKLVKPVKKDQPLARALYESGNSDAMYLAGLTVNARELDKETLRKWVRQAYWHMLAEYTVAWLAAESPHGHELAKEWIEDPEELIAVCGWSTYANWLSMKPDEELDLEEIARMLERIEADVHGERNYVRYVMNGFVIAVGVYVLPLQAEARRVAEAIGAVSVNLGDTACKVPLAYAYIDKTEAMGKTGRKKKTCIC